jgi:protein gp37
MRQAERIVRLTPGRSVYEGTVRNANGNPVWTGQINRASDATWRKPLKVKEPSMFFVNSMSDFFHEAARDEWRIEALRIMAATPHQYQILTKRPAEILAFLARTRASFPSNAWIGVTIERGDFVSRLDTLRSVPALIRFVSAEPLLGPLGPLDLSGIHWIITGGESGPGARPMHADWIREIRDACIAQRVPHFFKQWGTPQNNPLWNDAAARRAALMRARPETDPKKPLPRLTPTEWLATFDPHGKGGSTIDGAQWKQYPAFETQPLLI